MRWLAPLGLTLAAALCFGVGGRAQAPELFYKKDVRGRACASCHAPDGIDLKSFAFSESDMARRALQHLGPSDAFDLSRALVGGRPAGLPDPMEVRPYQPGGVILEGATPAERDAALGIELESRLPKLMGRPIRSASDAAAARREVLDLDPRTVPVGILTSRLSEDEFRGVAHATIADWYPDMPIAETPGLVAARAAYLAAPTSANLVALLDAVHAIRPRTTFDQISTFKYGALMLWQHALREHGPHGGAQMALAGNWNPVWMVGEIARLNLDGDRQFLGMPDDVFAKKSAGPSLAQQMDALRLPWLWMGWTLDPSLFRSGGERATVRGDYFVQALAQDGPYPLHTAFFLTKKVIEQGYRVGIWPYRVPQHFELQYTFFLINGNLAGREPAESAARERFRKFVKNAFRMDLYSVLEDVGRTGGCVRPESQLNQIKYIREYVSSTSDSETAADLKLCADAEAALRSARVEMR
jgi:hypothetical protein